MNAKKLQPPPEWRVSVEDWVKSLIASGYSEDTVRCRRYKLTHAAIGLGRSPVDVTTGDLVCWMAGQHWKPETLKAYRNTLTSFFGRLQRTGARPDNPAADLPKVKRPKAHPRPCPDKHILAAPAKANETETLMLRLAAECGLRRGEIAGVNSRDVMDDLLGHASVETTQIYVAMPDARLRAGMAAVMLGA